MTKLNRDNRLVTFDIKFIRRGPENAECEALPSDSAFSWPSLINFISKDTNLFLAPPAEGLERLCNGMSSIIHQLLNKNDFFSKTTLLNFFKFSEVVYWQKTFQIQFTVAKIEQGERSPFKNFFSRIDWQILTIS